MSGKADKNKTRRTGDTKEQALGQIISWLTDEAVELSALDLWEARDFVRFVQEHRIVGRALRRMSKAGLRDPWIDVYQSLTDLQMSILGKAGHGGPVLMELCRLANDDRQDLVVLKGNNLWIRTRDPYDARHSGDFDVIAGDMASLGRKLSSMGAVESKLSSSHEIINVAHRGYDFDLHNYFPMFRVLPGKAIKPEATFRELHIRHAANLAISRLTFDEIVPHCSTYADMGDFSVLLPLPALGAYITAMHLFTDWVRLFPAFMHQRPQVRLHEIFELRDLVRQPGFSSELLIRLAREHDTLRDLGHVVALAHRLTGDRALAELNARIASEEPDLESPFRHFLWFGFGIEAELSLGDTVMRPFAMAEALDLIRTNELTPPDTTSAPASFFCTERTEHAVLHSYGEVLKFELRVAVTPQAAEIEIEFDDHHCGSPSVSISIERDYLKFNLAAADPSRMKRVETYSAMTQFEYSKKAHSHSVKLTLHFAAETPRRARSSIAFGFVENNSTLKRGILVPLVIQRSCG